MTVWFVSRHAGAVDWARARGIHVDWMVDHLQVEEVLGGDVVLGTLPLDLVAEICRRGARYFHLTMQIPRHLRGHELSAAQMAELGASLRQFVVEAVDKETELEGLRGE